MIGNTAFLAPLIVTSPCSGTPPLINKLSMYNRVAQQVACLSPSHAGQRRFCGAREFHYFAWRAIKIRGVPA